MTRAALAVVVAGLTAAPAAAGGELTRGELAAHIRFLSDDLLEGRGIGTRGDRLAQAYLEAVLASAGAEPAFGPSYRQPVSLVEVEPDPALTLELLPPVGAAIRPAIGDQAVALLTPSHRGEAVEGELVFAGYAIDSERWGWDDFKGADLAGTVLLVLVNEPGRTRADLFEGPALTWHGRWTAKLEEGALRGAAGVLLVHSDADAGYGWTVVRNSWSGPAFFDPGDSPPCPLRGWVRETAARRALAAASLDLDTLRAAAERRDFRPRPTGIRVRVSGRCPSRTVETANVGGIVRGRGNGTARTVVVSAHHDHLGIGRAEDGDAIYNGAIDNGSALALMLALARALAARPTPLADDVLFLAPAAEEEGLLGSRAFLRSPPVPVERIVADLNLEMTHVWGRTRDLIAIGGPHSELGDEIARAALRHGLTVVPEPAPEQGFFFRSDQLSFARAGIPAVWIDCGETLEVETEPEAPRRRYRDTGYHRPSDEFDPAWPLAGTIQLGEVILDLIEALDARSEPPSWKPGAPFRRQPRPAAVNRPAAPPPDGG